MEGRISISPNGEFYCYGVDFGGKLSLISIRSNQIVYRVSGHTGWSGRGMTSYYPAHIDIADILERYGLNSRGDYEMRVKFHSYDIPVRGVDPFLKEQIKKMFNE